MIVEKFTNFAGTVSYTFDTTLMVDDYDAARPPITAQVSGAGGAFDFFGTGAYPVTPITVVKKWSVSKTTSAAIDDERLLVAQKIAIGTEGFLYLLDRDASTRYYTFAKCIGFSASETYQEKGRFLKSFQVTFFCRTGVWYNATGTAYSGLANYCYDDIPELWHAITVTLSGSLTYAGSFTISNAGYLTTPVTVVFDAPSSGTITAASVTNSTTTATLAWSGTSTAGLAVCSDVYKAIDVSIARNNEYLNLTPGAGQVLWLWANVGTNTITYATTVSNTGTGYVSVFWREAFIL